MATKTSSPQTILPYDLLHRLEAIKALSDLLNLTQGQKVEAIRLTVPEYSEVLQVLGFTTERVLPINKKPAFKGCRAVGGVLNEDVLEENIGLNTLSLTKLLKRYEIRLKPNTALKILVQEGLLTTQKAEKWYEWNAGLYQQKLIYKVTPLGSHFGRNVYPKSNSKDSNPVWYEDKFPEMIEQFFHEHTK